MTDINFQRLTEATADGVLIVDAQRRIRFANAAAAGLMHRDIADLVGTSFVYPFARDEVTEVDLRENGLETTPVEVRTARATWDGAPTTMVLLRDVSHRRDARDLVQRAERQMRDVQRAEAMGALASGLAHDYNNLLTVILGRCELMRTQINGDDRLARNVQLVQMGARRASVLTRQYLAISQRETLDPQVVDLNELLLDLKPLLEAMLGDTIRLRFEPAADLGSVHIDRGHLEQVVTNIALNARDAMPAGGRLLIETMNAELDDKYSGTHPTVEPGEYVCLALSDTGQGMDPAVRRRVFEPFFTTKSRTDARGLGLTTVHGIVTENGGAVWAYSEVGHGSTFKIYLPRVGDPVEVIAAPPIAAASSGEDTVLVVEDESDVRALVREVLESASFSVLEARNGTEGVRIVEQYQGDVQLMIADIVMPHMGGPDMAQKVQEAHPEIPVIFISGYTPKDVVRKQLLRENDVYLQKPFTPAQLVGKIREVLVT